MIVFLDTRKIKIKKLFTIASSHNILTKYMQDLYIDEIDFKFLNKSDYYKPLLQCDFDTPSTKRQDLCLLPTGSGL